MKIDEIFSFENLYSAHKICRCSKNHKGEVIRFEIDLARNISKLVKLFKEKKYKVGKYKCFYIYEPKERKIEALSYKDRVVLQCFCKNSVIPRLDKRLIFDNVACRKNKGTLFGIKRLKYFLKKEYNERCSNNFYYLKMDIKKYFPNINHNILIKKLKKVGFSKDEMWFLEKTLKEQPNKNGVGLPLGNQTSQWFALFYLDRIDRLIKEKLRIKGYIRYMDDMILIHGDKKYLRMCLENVRKICLEELGLELNSKTQIGKVSNGIDFLGFRHIVLENGKVIRKLRSSAKDRMKKHLKNLEKLKDCKIVDREYIMIRKNSFKAHLHYSNENIFKRKLDRILK